MENVREKVEKIQEDLKKNINLSQMEQLIKDNKISFDYKEKSYRVRFLNLKEKQELLRFQTRKENEMREEGIFKYETVLIPELKKAGIDIEGINKKIKNLQREEEKINLQLGEALKEQKPLEIVQPMHDSIIQIQDEKQALVIEKSVRLAASLENQLLDATITYIVYLSLEIKNEKNEYVKVFETYEKMLETIDNELIKKAVSYSTLLQYETE